MDIPPPLPPDNQLSPYTQYMMQSVQELKNWACLSCCTVTFMAMVGAALLFYILKWRREGKALIAEIKGMMVGIRILVNTAEPLLAAVKGWTVLHVIDESKKVQEVKQGIEAAKTELAETQSRVKQELDKRAADTDKKAEEQAKTLEKIVGLSESMHSIVNSNSILQLEQKAVALRAVAILETQKDPNSSDALRAVRAADDAEKEHKDAKASQEAINLGYTKSPDPLTLGE